MKLVTASQMTNLEQNAIQNYRIDGLLLMENAARSFCDALEAEWGNVRNKSIAVFCGKGNNGGDGFAISRHLVNRGAFVTVIADFDPADLKQDAKKNFDIISLMEIPVTPLSEAENKQFDMVVDALLGTGFHGVATGKIATLIDAINKSGAQIAAVDIPSGANCSDGAVDGPCVRADLTVTFALPKPGHYLYPAKEFCGKVVTTDISIPKKIVDDFPSSTYTLDNTLAETLPARSDNAHKGSFGKVLVFAGSAGMSGAAIMTTTAVLKTGAGMVTAAVPEALCELFAIQFPEAMTLSLPTENTAAFMLEKLNSQTVLLAGCGLGSAEETQNTMRLLALGCQKPMVIDADGINALAGHIHIIENKPVPVVLTPHPLEFSRISGLSVDYIQKNRLQTARDFAEKFGVVLVLKGADTVVAHPDGNAYISPVSNSGLAKAGSGDVLAGVIAALIAQGAKPGDAANLGVYLHSQAGIIARQKLGAYSMTASDVLTVLPDAIRELAR